VEPCNPEHRHGAVERYLNISADTTSVRSLSNSLQPSLLADVPQEAALDKRSAAATDIKAGSGDDGQQITDAQLDPASGIGGIYALSGSKATRVPPA